MEEATTTGRVGGTNKSNWNDYSLTLGGGGSVEWPLRRGSCLAGVRVCDFGGKCPLTWDPGL